MMLGAYSGGVPTVDTGLVPGISQTNFVNSGSWTFSPSNPAYAIDGNDSTYAQYTGLSSSVTTSGSIVVVFAAIEASEILEVRFRCKGKGGSGGSNSHTVVATSAADLSPVPTGVWLTLASFVNGGATTTVDTGLVTTDYASSDSSVTVNFDASGLIGSSAEVLNWWAGGARLTIYMSDYNGGGTGGLNYSPMLQVVYKP